LKEIVALHMRNSKYNFSSVVLMYIDEDDNGPDFEVSIEKYL